MILFVVFGDSGVGAGREGKVQREANVVSLVKKGGKFISYYIGDFVRGVRVCVWGGGGGEGGKGGGEEGCREKQTEGIHKCCALVKKG